MNELIQIIEQLPGFKVPNTHFRIGSKIHISPFYYAKRFFQNSFFSSRLSFLIVRDILKNHSERIEDFRQNGLTLIGYGLYSELLLSLVEKFLKTTVGTEKINHDLVSDVEELNLMKNYEDIYPNIIIIVPIASTFSTAIKIEQKLQNHEKFLNKQFLSPHINVLFISHREDSSLDPTKPSEIEAKFGWTKKNPLEKTVSVNAFFSEVEKTSGEPAIKDQKYFLTLPSQWDEIEKCQNCFPTDPSKEKPLFYTDKTSVTPTLIFGFPKARNSQKAKNPNQFNLLPETVNYGHYVRDKNHFHFYIRIEEFFRNNKAIVTEWLKNLKAKLINDNCYSETDRVVIIAPGHFSNAGFVNMVNEVLFSNAANIIHYDARSDDIQNFQLFYGNEVKDPNVKVFFVDDAITSGTTFIRTNYFLKHSREDQKGFNALIVLLDRSSHFVHQNVLRKLDFNPNLYLAFANLDLPSLKGVDEKCPLCNEDNRYENLVENSFLDRLKIHFLEQRKKLAEKNISKFTFPSSTVKNLEKNEISRYTRQIEAIHRIYNWFSLEKNITDFQQMTFDSWKRSLLDDTESPFVESLFKTNRNDNAFLSKETDTLLKVLSQPPFINYKPLRERIFEWTIKFLDRQREKVINEIDAGGLQYKTFRDLKFLIRRAGLLNSNYLISIKFFELIQKMYCENGIESLIEKKTAELIIALENQNKTNELVTKIPPQLSFDFDENAQAESPESLQATLESLKRFTNFCAAQIKELLYLNEARSIRLEEILHEFNEKENLSRSFTQLLRILREENGIIIQKFWEFFESDTDLKHLTIEDFQNGNIKNTLERPSILNHYRYQTLKDYFVKDNQSQIEPHENTEFLNYLFLMSYFKNDQSSSNTKDKTEESDKQPDLSEKTGYIVEKMNQIICPNTENSGAFLVVKYKSSKYSKLDPPRFFFAYNKGSSGGINESKWNPENFLFLQNFFKGEDKKTIIELYRNQSGEWIDLYATEENLKVIDLDPLFVPRQCNKLLLLKLGKKKLESNEQGESVVNDYPQGVIGFYFSDNSQNPTDVNKTRYLLLLRSAMSNFIQNHHENDEFRDWIEADIKRHTALLTGHGREMLINIAKKDPKYLKIIYTILLTQRLILDLEDENAHFQNEGREFQKSVLGIFKELFKPGDKKNNDNGSQSADTTLEKTDENSPEFITKANFEEIKKMADYIYASPIIENEEACNVKLDYSIPDTVEFKFSLEILQMICFELFVNAKKNRWIFRQGDKIPVGSEFYEENEILINVEPVDDGIRLTISNTGPLVEDTPMEELRGGGNPKGKQSVAGLNLVRNLLDSFNLGNISFDQEQLFEKLGRFKVVMKLKNW